MNKLFTILFSFVCLSFIIAGQKNYTVGDKLQAPVFTPHNGSYSIAGHTPDDTIAYLNNGGIYSVSGGGGYVVGTNIYGDLGKYQRFDINHYLLKGFMFYTRVRVITGASDTLSFVVKEVNTDGSPGNTLATVRQATNQLAVNGWTSFTLPNGVPVKNSVFIGYEWTSAVNDTFGLACDLAGYGYGEGQHRAWEKLANGTLDSMGGRWNGFDVDLWIAAIAEPVLDISAARIDANNDLIPDRLNDTLTVSGVCFTPNYQTSNRSYYIWDGTGGICTFRAGLTSPALNYGDAVIIRGQIQQYNGLTELAPLTDASVWVVETGAPVPNPIYLNPGQYKTNTEQYEGSLVQVGNLNKISGTWPGTGSSANITMTNSNDTLVVRIDSDTDIDGNPEPVWPRDIIGVVSQYTTGALNTGYQLQPRYYATDFPAPTPVELSALSASVSGKSVILNWSTVTEKNNKGFEIQRSSDKVSFETIGFINGNGTSVDKHEYSYTDNNVLSAKNYYRLRQVDFDGAYKLSSIVEAEVGAINSYSLDQNYPNPFNPSTQIKYTLSSNSNVKISIYNALGQMVKELANEVQQSGVHVINFNAAGLSSGIYFYSIQANSVDGSQSFSNTKKMILMK